MNDTNHSMAMVVGGNEAVALVRSPQLALSEARQAADALMAVIAAKKNKLEFNGEQYLENEDWQTISTFHGCTVDIEWTRPVVLGDAMGWEARAVLIDRNGRVLSHAEAMCLNDEERWSARPKYAWAYCKKSGGTSLDDPGPGEIVWEASRFKKSDGTIKNMPKKEKVLVGMEPVPQFQLRSMAQTRASSKVMSNVFRWVVQIAGFKGTPAEEMDGLIAGQQQDHQEEASAAPKNVTPKRAAAATAAAKTAAAAPAAQETVVDAASGEQLPKVTVASVTAKSWKDANGKDNPMWEITFSDGRVAMAFDPAINVAASEAHATGAPVDVVLEESKKRAGAYRVTELRVVTAV